MFPYFKPIYDSRIRKMDEEKNQQIKMLGIFICISIDLNIIKAPIGSLPQNFPKKTYSIDKIFFSI